MGTDINAYPEVMFEGPSETSWLSIAGGFHLSRNRELFQLVGYADARLTHQSIVQPMFTTRGLPTDLGWDASREAFIGIDWDWRTDNAVTREDAMMMVENGTTTWADKSRNFIRDPDILGATWLFSHEYSQVLQSAVEEKPSTDWLGLLALLNEYEKHGASTRVILWFDS